MRDYRSIRVVKDNALLVIEPARGFVDFGNDRADSKDSDSIPQDTFGPVKGLSLPAKYVDEFRDFLTELGAGRNNRRSFGRTIRDVTGRALGEEIVKISVRHLQQLRHIVCHSVGAP